MKRKSLLFIDDSYAVQQLVKRFLANEPWSVCVAANEQEAVQAVRSEPFQLVLMDIELAETDGYRLKRRLQVEFPDSIPPFLALSGHDSPEFTERVRSSGFVGSLRKPFTRESLIRFLSPFL